MKNFSVVSALVVGMGLGVALISFGGCKKGGSDSGDVVAVVNGTPITEKEYLHYMMLKPTVMVAGPRGPIEARVVQSIGAQAFDDVVQQKLVIQMAKEQGVEPTDADINKEIDFRIQGNPNFAKNLMAQGLDMEAIKQALKVELCQDNIVGKGITVTDADVEQYRKDHPEVFTDPARLELEWVWVKSEDAKKQVDDELAKGQPFNVVAMQFSEDPNAKTRNGEYNTDIEKQIPADIKKVTANVQPLHTSDWLAGSNNSGWAKFYVVKRTPATPVQMTDHLKEETKRQIRRDRGAKAREIQSQLLAEEQKSTVDIKLGGLQDYWEAHMKELAQAKAVGGASAGTVPTPTATGTTGAATTTGGAAPATSAKGGASTSGSKTGK